jgi:hypothetical protein
MKRHLPDLQTVLDAYEPITMDEYIQKFPPARQTVYEKQYLNALNGDSKPQPRYAARVMVKRGENHIVNVSDIGPDRMMLTKKPRNRCVSVFGSLQHAITTYLIS